MVLDFDTCIQLISFEFSFYSQNLGIDIVWRKLLQCEIE